MSERGNGVTRRAVLGAVGLGAVLPRVASGAEKPGRRGAQGKVARPDGSPIVLVHGAWHGGWAWRRLAPLLRKAGHPVFSPTLTGVGEREHLLSREVSLTTHVEDVRLLLEFEDLRDVILVGHSYGGAVVTGAAAVPERIARLVYLDAFVPESGTSVFDNMPPKLIEHWRQAAKERGEGWKVPPMLDARSMGVTVAEEARWLDPRLRPMPLACFEQSLQFDEAKLAKLSREYLRCTGFGGFGPTADRLKRSGWSVRELEAGHDVMVAAPAELARALIGT